MSDILERLRAWGDEELHRPDGEFMSGAYPNLPHIAADEIESLRRENYLLRNERDNLLDNVRRLEGELKDARSEGRSCAKCNAVLAPGPQPSATYDDDDTDYYRPDSSGYSRADEEWFFEMDGKP